CHAAEAFSILDVRINRTSIRYRKQRPTRRASEPFSMTPTQPVIIAGAGPVGLCLALYLARRDVRSIVLEALPAERFLDQVLRAGTIHPATLEMLDDLGLYPRLEARGLIAPIMQYWDRHTDTMFAEFDHSVLKDDTRFPYVLQCDRL